MKQKWFFLVWGFCCSLLPLLKWFWWSACFICSWVSQTCPGVSISGWVCYSCSEIQKTSTGPESRASAPSWEVTAFQSSALSLSWHSVTHQSCCWWQRTVREILCHSACTFRAKIFWTNPGQALGLCKKIPNTDLVVCPLNFWSLAGPWFPQLQNWKCCCRPCQS